MPLLRAFSFYTLTTSKSIFTYPCSLSDLNGTLVSGGPNVYFQVFDKASAPVANDVPIQSWLITGTGPTPLVSIYQIMGPVPFVNGLAVGISTTDQKYTAATATYDIWGDIEEGLQDVDAIPGLSTGGDATTHVQTLSGWNDGDSSNSTRLFKVQASNILGAGGANDRWLMIFAQDPAGSTFPVANATPWYQTKITGGTSTTLFFGGAGDGSLIQQTYLDTTTNTLKHIYGCILVISTTAKFLTLGSTDMTCKIWYKVVSNY